MSCSGGNSEADSARLQSVLQDVHSINNWSEHNPVEVFLELANREAEESIAVSKATIGNALYKAKSYEYCAMVVDNHTLVTIADVEHCQNSGSWNECMPYAVGYIQKSGKLVAQRDYLNNIIGRPDMQQRVLFLFNKLEPEVPGEKEEG